MPPTATVPSPPLPLDQFCLWVEAGRRIYDVIRETHPTLQPHQIVSIQLVNGPTSKAIWPGEPECPGCREKQPNQLAHMGEGGCLHLDS